jgi:hypothetical protein
VTTTGAAQLDDLRRQLDACDARAGRLAAACTPAQWQSRSATGGWSPSECVQHLVLSADAMLSRVEAALADGRARQQAGTGPFTAGLLGRLLIWGLEPPYRMKSKTGPAFVPRTPRTPDEDVTALRQAHDRVRAALDQAAGLALDRLSIASPFFERARYNVYAALAVLPVHARRHLWQAEQTLGRSTGG